MRIISAIAAFCLVSAGALVAHAGQPSFAVNTIRVERKPFVDAILRTKRSSQRDAQLRALIKNSDNLGKPEFSVHAIDFASLSALVMSTKSSALREGLLREKLGWYDGYRISAQQVAPFMEMLPSASRPEFAEQVARARTRSELKAAIRDTKFSDVALLLKREMDKNVGRAESQLKREATPTADRISAATERYAEHMKTYDATKVEDRTRRQNNVNWIKKSASWGAGLIAETASNLPQQHFARRLLDQAERMTKNVSKESDFWTAGGSSLVEVALRRAEDALGAKSEADVAHRILRREGSELLSATRTVLRQSLEEKVAPKRSQLAHVREHHANRGLQLLETVLPYLQNDPRLQQIIDEGLSQIKNYRRHGLYGDEPLVTTLTQAVMTLPVP